MDLSAQVKFKGDNYPPELSNLSLNNFFTIGNLYDVYWESELQSFIVIGDDQNEYQFLNNDSWEVIKHY